MQPLSFDLIQNGWNAIKASGAPNLKKLVSGFIDPRRIFLQRVAETPDTLTVMFKGFDQALDDPENDGPLLKRAILAWIKNFSLEVQIEHGDPQSFILRILKKYPEIDPAMQMAENRKWTEALLSNLPIRNIDESLVHIAKVKNA
jgi:hypothetical protein